MLDESEDSSLGVSPDKPGVLFVKVKNFSEELSKFSNTGRYAVGIYTDNMDSMMIIKHLGSIGFIMFNVDNREYHLFGLKGSCDVRKNGDLDPDRGRNNKYMSFFISLDIDASEELDSSQLFPISMEAGVHPIYVDMNSILKNTK